MNELLVCRPLRCSDSFRFGPPSLRSPLSSGSQDEFPAPDEFPVVDEFPSVLKWRRKPSVVSVSSSLPDLLGNSTSSLSPADTPFKSEQLLEGDKTLSRAMSMQCHHVDIKSKALFKAAHVQLLLRIDWLEVVSCL